jgi:hypothetical protein
MGKRRRQQRQPHRHCEKQNQELAARGDPAGLHSIERNADPKQRAGEERPRYDAEARQFLAIRRHR